MTFEEVLPYLREGKRAECEYFTAVYIRNGHLMYTEVAYSDVSITTAIIKGNWSIDQ